MEPEPKKNYFDSATLKFTFNKITIITNFRANFLLLFFNFLPKSVFVIDTICFLFVIFGQPAASFYAYFRPFRNKMTNILQNWRKSLERCLGFEPGTNELSNGGHFLPQSVFAIDPICLLKAHYSAQIHSTKLAF